MIEGRRQRDAFDVYLRLGAQRSIVRLHEELRVRGTAPTLRTLCAWSGCFGWQERIARFEQEARRGDEEDWTAAMREMNERQQKEGLLLQQVAAEWLTQLDRNRVTFAALVRAFEVGARLEREARGAPTQQARAVDARAAAQRLADELGIDVDDLLAQAEDIARRM